MDYTGTDYLGAFHRVYADGQALGMHIIMATSRLKGIPSAVDDVTQQLHIVQKATRPPDIKMPKPQILHGIRRSRWS